MNINAAMLRQMREEGLDFDAAIRVLEAAEMRSDPTAAERQRRCRANKKVNGHTVTVTRDKGSYDRDILTSKTPPQVISDEITPPIEIVEKLEVKPEHVLEAFNAMADRVGLPKARMTPERRKKLSPFIRRHPIDDITEAISAIECSPFCRGENDRGWRADFDFLLQPKSFTKLIEGTYGQ